MRLQEVLLLSRTTLGFGLAAAALAGLTSCGPGGEANTGATAAPAVSGASPGAGPAGDHRVGRLRQVDRNALVALEHSGANLSCPHDIENEIEVRRQADGDAISQSLSSNAYFVRVATKPGGNVLVIVEETLVPTDGAVVKMVAAMKKIAAAHHGTYDRWETTPVKSC